MKVNKPRTQNDNNRGISLKELRAAEKALGVYLGNPMMVSRTGNQQFGVYDEDEKHAGDIVASGRWFSDFELYNKIVGCFRQ